MSTLIVSLLVVVLVVLLILSVLVVGLLRSYATVLARLHRLDGGLDEGVEAPSVAPPFRTADGVAAPPTRNASAARSDADQSTWPPAHNLVGQGLSGEIVSVRAVGVPHDTVITFLSSGCTGCATFWSDLADGNGATALGGGRVVVVTKDPQEESVGRLLELRPAGVDLIMSSAAWSDYQVPGSPYVIVVDGRTGRVKGEGSGTSLRQVSGLMRQATGDVLASRAVSKPRADTEREVDVDRALLAAGIGPGDPSLYATEPPVVPAEMSAHRRLDLVAASDPLRHSHSQPGAVR
ncbi:MAG TPA: hypothetical protein VIJ23_05300 [Mycobacterium sp.]